MLKKVTSILLSSLLLISVLGGCGQSGDSTPDSTGGAANSNTGKQVTLTLYCNAVVKNDTPDIIAKFEEANPNIKVNYVELPADATQKNQTLSTILQAKDASMDLFLMDTTWPQSYQAAGWLEPLDDVMTDQDKDQFLPGPLQANQIGGKQYALPVFMDTGILIYRKDLLDKYNFQAPKTWDELAEQSKKIMASEPTIKSGFVGAWKQYEGLTCGALEFVWGYGGEVLDKSGNVVLNSKETAAGLQRMYDLTYKDKITDAGINGYAFPDAGAVFNSGSSVFFRAWPSNYASANDTQNSQVAGKVAFAPLPAGPAGSYNTLGGWSIAVSNFSAHKAEAKKFVKFFTNADSNKIRAMAGGNLPVAKSVYDDKDILEKHPEFKELLECAKNVKERPKTSSYAELSGVIQQGVSSILSNGMTVQEAIDSMEPQIKEIINK